MILAVDCGTRTGWCLWRQGKVVESGVEDFSRKRGESHGSMYLRFRKWFMDFLTTDAVKFVAYEAPLVHGRGASAISISVNMTGRIEECCAFAEREYAHVHLGTLKKFATGKGNAGKDEMKVIASQILRDSGHAPLVTDDNEADAICIAKWAANEYGEL